MSVINRLRDALKQVSEQRKRVFAELCTALNLDLAAMVVAGEEEGIEFDGVSFFVQKKNAKREKSQQKFCRQLNEGLNAALKYATKNGFKFDGNRFTVGKTRPGGFASKAARASK